MKLRNKETGEIVDWDGIHIASDNDGEMFDSIAELNEAWEDYKTTEPLIKDPKIRNAVRAWAEANEVERVAVLYHSVWEASMTEIAKIDNASLRTVFLGDLGIKRGYTTTDYTIAELCGKEEE